ncbi:MAG: PAS domain S-box protein [Burkholderiaceae bacterium]|nr:PAS domain S-box protein [Burkholderiaceae bacterium]
MPSPTEPLAGPTDPPELAMLARAAADTAALAAALACWPAALVVFEDGLIPPAVHGALPVAEALARLRAMPPDPDGRAPATGGDATVVQRMGEGGRCSGWLAVFGPAGSAADPALPDRLAALGRGLAAQAEAVLQARQFARIAAQVPGMLYQYRLYPDGRSAFPFASEGIRTVYRVTPQAVQADASTLFALGHPDDVPRVVASIAESARTLALWDCEYRVCFDDGSTHWLHGRAMPERLPDGGTLWHGFITPVDARKQAESALQRSEQAFRAFFEAGLVGMTIAEADMRWLGVNARMAELLGYTPEELRQLNWADFTHPDDLPQDQANYARLVAGEIEGYVMDKRYRRKDGSLLECRLAVRCERADDGSLARVFAIVEDISDWRRAERALQAQRDALEVLVSERTRDLEAARDAAERANRAKSEFLSSMSHELRTPLNAILGFGQLLEMDRNADARSRGHLREVMRAGRHLLRLINEVLDLAQVESGRLVLSPEALALAELVDEVVALTAPLAAPRHVKLCTTVAPALAVRADRLRLKQVLVNLLGNAVKYNREGGEVRITAQILAPERLRLVVEDDGAGIPAGRRDLLFQPFSRLGAELGSVEGTGIGLALSRRLVELMGGHIGVDDAPSGGAAFWVELPPATLAPAPPPVVDAAPAEAGLTAARVLYIEDNPANLALVEQIVARHPGLLLSSATDGPAGLAAARAQRPALILLDIHLPGMDGYEVLARLRADPLTREVPVVALTAQAMPSDARRAIEAGFAEYLSKPIDLPVFDTMLRRFLA